MKEENEREKGSIYVINTSQEPNKGAATMQFSMIDKNPFTVLRNQIPSEHTEEIKA